MADEKKFQKWYAGHAKKMNLNPDPDHPKHFYDYRAAYKAGVEPVKIGNLWKWPSKYKREGHPQMVVGGVHTKTGKPIRKGKRPPRKVMSK